MKNRNTLAHIYNTKIYIKPVHKKTHDPQSTTCFLLHCLLMPNDNVYSHKGGWTIHISAVRSVRELLSHSAVFQIALGKSTA